MVPRKPTVATRTIAADYDYRIKRNGFRTIGLSWIAFGYELYWFHVIRELVSRELGAKDRVGLQTLGLCVPVLQVFIVFWLARDINRLRERVGLKPFNAALYVLLPYLTLAVGLVLLVIFMAIALMWGTTHPDPPWWAFIILFPGMLMLLVSSILFYVYWGLLNARLNEYWDAVTDHRAQEAEFRGGEYILIALGIIWFAFSMLIGALSDSDYGHPDDRTPAPYVESD